MPHVETHHHII